MQKFFVLIFLFAIFAVPTATLAHGLVQDGHDQPLRAIDYIELVGISLGSLGMIVYSLDQWRKDKRKKDDK
jgi:hypothetical protein